MINLIISDIHEKAARVRYILEEAKKHNYDNVYYLGDWFDSFTSTPESVNDTIQLLREESSLDNRNFCWGNHDSHYGSQFGVICSGYKYSTFKQICSSTNKEDCPLFDKFKIAHEVDGWLLSHAGFNPHTEKYIKRCLNSHDDECMGFVGTARGGWQTRGGPLWLDWNEEFSPIDGLKQLVGHTPVPSPKNIGDNWNIDTHLNHYAIIKNGDIEIFNL
jgi:hypothetical protein